MPEGIIYAATQLVFGSSRSRTPKIILLFDRNSFHNFNLNFAIKKKKKIPAFRQFPSSNSSALILLKTKNNKSTVHVS